MSAAAWTAAEVAADTRWQLQLDDAERAELLSAVRTSHRPGRPLLAYRRADFPLQRCLPTLARAFAQVRGGRGLALVKGLPRAGLSAEQFAFMTWGIGLHFGVARPQNRQSVYLNEVRDAGTVYRSATGRGYSSNAELDFHVDGADVVALSCYNQAAEGGTSMCSSSAKAWETITAERPDLAVALRQPYPFSRNGEEAPGQAPWYDAPVCGIEAGASYCMWVRNRVQNALQLPGCPPLDAVRAEALDYLDAVVRRPALMYSMQLEPGDLQLLSNHTVLHSRTAFVDHSEPERKRTLFRLWLATPDSPDLPAGWEQFYGTRVGGVVRGGIRGQQYDQACRDFDAAQATAMGMPCHAPA